MSNIQTNLDVVQLLSAAGVLMISLAWNSLITKSLQYNFNDTDEQTISAQAIYTISLTIVIGLFLFFAHRYKINIMNFLTKFKLPS